MKPLQPRELTHVMTKEHLIAEVPGSSVLDSAVSAREQRLVSVLAKMARLALSRQSGAVKQLSFEQALQRVPRSRVIPGSRLSKRIKEAVNRRRKKRLLRENRDKAKQLMLF